jgi:hypothetical protein
MARGGGRREERGCGRAVDGDDGRGAANEVVVAAELLLIVAIGAEEEA